MAARPRDRMAVFILLVVSRVVLFRGITGFSLMLERTARNDRSRKGITGCSEHDCVKRESKEKGSQDQPARPIV